MPVGEDEVLLENEDEREEQQPEQPHLQGGLHRPPEQSDALVYQVYLLLLGRLARLLLDEVHLLLSLFLNHILYYYTIHTANDRCSRKKDSHLTWKGIEEGTDVQALLVL